MVWPARRLALLLFLWCLLLYSSTRSVHARGEVLGIHILSPGELTRAHELLENGDDKDKFVTVPLTLADLQKPADWQQFLTECHRLKVRPLIRLTTRFEDGHWIVPTRSDIMAYALFLKKLEWHRPELTVILFNEPNHAREWGGQIDPVDFADISEFAARWFQTETKEFTVLPAAMDLAADGKNGTMEAFAYWQVAILERPGLLDLFDGWNSHSYPNPAFAAAPSKTGKNSLRGYENELAFIKKYTNKELPVYITETGWNQELLSDLKVRNYFAQAYEQIWSKDTRIVAVTPFVLQGAPGTFAPFSFLDERGNPTIAYEAYKNLLEGKN